VEQKKLRKNFEAKSDALLKMHGAVKLSANASLKGPNGNAKNENSTAFSPQLRHSTPDACEYGDKRWQLSPEGRLIPSALLSAVFDGYETRGGSSSRVILEAGPELSSEDNDSNTDVVMLMVIVYFCTTWADTNRAN